MFPIELRQRLQWIVWRYEQFPDEAKPRKMPYCPHTAGLASVTAPHTWGSLEQAQAALTSGRYNGLGFVLTSDDPFSFIDLDCTSDEKERELHAQIYERFVSYSERSPSGTGAHIIVSGVVPMGRKRHHVEVYSSGRYMTMTGDVLRDLPINYYQEDLQAVYEYISPPTLKGSGSDFDGPQTRSDDELIHIAYHAKNGDKFRELYIGEWGKHYPSQSEGDWALINIVAHYTDNRDQVRRIFHASALGKRGKAHRGIYLERMIDAAFDRKMPGANIDALTAQYEAWIAEQRAVKAQSDAAPVRAKAIRDASMTNDYPYPPGLIGETAEFIFAAAPRPIREVALIAAMGLIAGIAGRCYNISGTGLNQYFFLVGQAGVGKNSISKGIRSIKNALTGGQNPPLPNAKTFFGPEKIASPEGLIKHLAEHPCFVSYTGEIGHELRQMSGDYASGNKVGLKSLLLALYMNSGQGEYLGGMAYSDKSKNTRDIQSPAFTWMGETTPDMFYPNIDEGMVNEGLIPRLFTIETFADVPALNKDHRNVKPSDVLLGRFAELCAYSIQLNQANRVAEIAMSPAAEKLFDEYDEYTRGQINAETRSVRRNMWGRAGLKALRLAGLVAVGENYLQPTVTEENAVWAIQLATQDAKNMLTKFDAGEIVQGDAEAQQIAKIVSTVRDWIRAPWDTVKVYAPSMDEMFKAKVIPYAFLQRRNAAVAAFKRDPRGATAALQRAIKVLIDRGDLVELPKHDVSKKFGTACIAYAVTNYAAFGV